MRTLIFGAIYMAVALLLVTPLCASIPMSWEMEGVTIKGFVDPDADVFVVTFFENDGPTTTYVPATLPIEMDAMTIDGAPFDVLPEFDGIGDDWLFVGPLHATIDYIDGPTSGDGFHFTWGGSEALSGATFGQDERVMNLAVGALDSGTFITTKHAVAVPEPAILGLAAAAAMLFGALGLRP